MDTLKYAVLRSVMNHGAIKKSSLLKIIQNIAKADLSEDPMAIPNEKVLDSLIEQINAQISTYDQKILPIHYAYEKSDNTYITYNWTNEAVVNRFQITYHEGEVRFFFLLIKEMIEDEEYSIKPIQALNLTSQIEGKAVTKSRAERLLQEWSSAGYFQMIKNAYRFGPRLITEFSLHLKQHYPEAVKNCKLCGMPTFWSVQCAECEIYLHSDCFEKYQKKVKTCPGCKKTWRTKE